MAREDKKRSSKSNSSPRDSKNSKKNGKKDDQAMIAKVNQQMAEDDDSLMARIIGLGLIILGVVFILLAIVVVVLSRREPDVDKSIEKPTIEVEDEYTDKEEIKVTGEVDDATEVIFWVDGDLQEDSAEVEDGEFSYEIEVDEEGEYEIEAAAVSGFPIRKRSEKTDPLKVVVDWTRPSDEVELEYSETSTDGTFEISGTIDPETEIILRDKETEEEYSATSDEDGMFEISGIELEADSAEFDVILRDRAGNERELDESIKVLVSNGSADGDMHGDLNGDGVTDSSDLPESSGELEAALQFLFGNRLMMLFGLIALAVLAVNGGVVAYKLRQ